MTKLYHGPAGWQHPGTQLKTARKVEVPNSSAPLAAWLNERLVPIAPPEGAIEDLLFGGQAVVRTNGDGTADRIEPSEFYAPAPDDEAAAVDRRTRCPECKALLIATAAGADRAAIGRTVERIANWLDTAPDWAVTRLAEELQERSAAIRDRGKAH